MPIYEYYCRHCGKKFELLRSFSEADTQANCEFCGSKEVRRQLSKINAFSDGASLNAGGQCSSCSSGNCSSCGG
ncbi:MAG: zinc ribbon domain-containing protein [Chloroflexi bacterium]|nr:zinc ribbon domain-containing protein [Chloroflexota bacterium]